MPMTKVRNRNVHPHSEMYKGALITIPAHGFVEMEWEEGVQFASQFTGIATKLPDGNDDARMYKMITVDPPSEPIFPNDMTCHADGKKAATKADLIAMLEKYSDRRADDPDAEKVASTENAELKARIARLEDLIAANQAQVPRGPGRPRKEAAE